MKHENARAILTELQGLALILAVIEALPPMDGAKLRAIVQAIQAAGGATL